MIGGGHTVYGKTVSKQKEKIALLPLYASDCSRMTLCLPQSFKLHSYLYTCVVLPFFVPASPLTSTLLQHVVSSAQMCGACTRITMLLVSVCCCDFEGVCTCHRKGWPL
jgi:hypothetical protein